MNARKLRCLLAAAALLAALPGHAQEGAEHCQIPAASAEPLGDRAGLLAQFQRLPRACLQQIFNDCQQAASSSLLDFGSAAVCSLGYEALLSQHFRGEFDELLTWWRDQRPQDMN